MDKLAKLITDIGKLWETYSGAYFTGIRNTLVLAVVATLIGCVIGLLCRNGVYRLVGAHIGPDDGTMNWGQAVLSAVLLAIVIAIVYLACLWALRAEELTSVVGMLAARIPGLGNKPKSGGTASPNGKLEQSTAENGDQE